MPYSPPLITPNRFTCRTWGGTYRRETRHKTHPPHTAVTLTFTSNVLFQLCFLTSMCGNTPTQTKTLHSITFSQLRCRTLCYVIQLLSLQFVCHVSYVLPYDAACDVGWLSGCVRIALQRDTEAIVDNRSTSFTFHNFCFASCWSFVMFKFMYFYIFSWQTKSLCYEARWQRYLLVFPLNYTANRLQSQEVVTSWWLSTQQVNAVFFPDFFFFSPRVHLHKRRDVWLFDQTQIWTSLLTAQQHILQRRGKFFLICKTNTKELNA